MSARLSSGLAGLAADDTVTGAGPAILEASPAAIAALPADLRQAVAEVFAQAISTVFLVAVAFAVVALLLVLLLEEKPLRETVHVAGGGPAEDLTLTFEEIEPDHVMTPPPATARQGEGPPPG